MKKKKNNNKELIINSLNDEFDNRGRKKYTKKELKKMISLEDFLLKYYDRYSFYIAERYAFFDGDLFSVSYDSFYTLFNGRFDNDVELIKFIDENKLDFVYIDSSYKDINIDYCSDDMYISLDDPYILIYINTLDI